MNFYTKETKETKKFVTRLDLPQATGASQFLDSGGGPVPVQ